MFEDGYAYRIRCHVHRRGIQGTLAGVGDDYFVHANRQVGESGLSGERPAVKRIADAPFKTAAGGINLQAYFARFAIFVGKGFHETNGKGLPHTDGDRVSQRNTARPLVRHPGHPPTLRYILKLTETTVVT